MRRWHTERDARRADLLLGAHEALRHRLLRHEERTRDLLRAQTAERAQRQRDLRVELQRGMAAGEDELEALVRDRRLVHLVLRPRGHVEQPRLGGERPVPADAVDRAVPCGGGQPRPRALRRPVAGPALRGERERLLRGLLGEVEVAEEADQRCDDAAPFVAEGLVEGHRLVLDRRPDLDRAAEPRGGNARRELDRRVEVVGLEDEVAAERLLDGDERAVRRQGLPVLHAHGRRQLGRLHPDARRHARRLVDRLVVGGDPLLLFRRQRGPSLLVVRRRGVALVDQHHVLHLVLLLDGSPMRRTGDAEMDTPTCRVALPRLERARPRRGRARGATRRRAGTCRARSGRSGASRR